MDMAPDESLYLAEITGDSSGKVGEKLDFFGNAYFGTEPYSYYWDFDDDSTSTDQNPSHKYSKEGQYSVKLIVTDNNGNEANETLIVNISGGSSTNGNGNDNKNKDDSDSGLFLFVGVIAIIVVLGIVVVVLVLRR
jgi:hypothetical protein